MTLSALWFIYHSPFWPFAPRLWDYPVLVSSAALWAHGEDPYDNALVRSRWNERSPGLGIELKSELLQAISTPTTLVALAPVGLLPATLGSVVWMVGTMALMAYAAVEVARWAGLRGRWAWTMYAVGILVAGPPALALRSGNTIGLAAPLVLLAMAWSKRRGMTAGLLMAIGTALKLQVGLPLLLFLAFVGRWRTATVGLGTLAIIAAIGVGRLEIAGVDWRHGLARNLAETNGALGMNDFANDTSAASDFLNLQTALWPLLRDRLACNAIAWSLAIVGTAMLAVIAWRRRRSGERAILLGLMGTAGLSMIPIYHRPYDAPTLLPLLAIGVVGLRSSDVWKRRASIAVIVCFLPYCIPGSLPALLERPRGIPHLQANVLYRAFFVAIRPWTNATHAALAIALLWRIRPRAPAVCDHFDCPSGKIG